MSNYSYLRKIIEKIAEKGKVPKKDIADIMGYARSNSGRIRDVDNYINNPLLEHTRNKKSLDDYLSEVEQDLGAEYDYTSSPWENSGVNVLTHNKYGKYIPIRRRINEREYVLQELFRNSENEEKTKIYEALLERLRNHPLYNE